MIEVKCDNIRTRVVDPPKKECLELLKERTEEQGMSLLKENGLNEEKGSCTLFLTVDGEKKELIGMRAEGEDQAFAERIKEKAFPIFREELRIE